MPTLNVLDGTGSPQTINTLPSSGQSVMASSLPVVEASDSPLIVSIGSTVDTAYTNTGSASLISVVKGIFNKFLGATRNPTLIRVTNAGTISAGAQSATFANTGTANATVLGTILKPGESIEFGCKWTDTLGSITYDASTSGAELFIITIS